MEEPPIEKSSDDCRKIEKGRKACCRSFLIGITSKDLVEDARKSKSYEDQNHWEMVEDLFDLNC